MSDGSGKYLFAMVLVVLLGFALGAAQLNADFLRLDEMASVGITSDIFPVLQFTVEA